MRCQRLPRISNAALFALLVTTTMVRSTSADNLVAYWDFNNKNENGTEAYGHLPDAGTGFVQIDPTWNRDFAGVNRGITAFQGTINNAQTGTPAGLALALQGGIDEDNTPGNPPNNNKWLQIQANLSDYVNPILSFAMFRSFNTPGGFNNNQLSWSTDGVNFTDFDVPFDPGITFAARTYDFSAVDALDGAANAYFRITFNGATTNGGHNRIDNILLMATAIPEPGLGAAAALGCLLAMARRRRG